MHAYSGMEYCCRARCLQHRLAHTLKHKCEHHAGSLALVAQLQGEDGGIVLVDSAIHGIFAIDELGHLQSMVGHTSDA